MPKSHYYNQSSGEGTWSEYFGDVYSGVAVGIGHPKWFVARTLSRGWDALASLGGSSSHNAGTDEGTTKGATPGDNETKPRNEGQKSAKGGLRVVGVGYGRTGTYSLALALDQLGIPTLHTQHLYENSVIFDHWVNSVFRKSILDDRITMGEPNFDLLAEGGYAATMDLPFALYWERIAERYPECRFILTVRENSDVWFKSWDVLTRSISKPAQYTSFIFAHVRKLEYYMR